MGANHSAGGAQRVQLPSADLAVSRRRGMGRSSARATSPKSPSRIAPGRRAGRRRSVFGRLPPPPLPRIDDVWISDHWQPLDAWVGGDAGSDHLPVLALVALVSSG